MTPGYEVFHAEAGDMSEWFEEMGAETPAPAGWYLWACHPGCLPDGPPEGPFPSESAARAQAEAQAAALDDLSLGPAAL